MGRGSDKFYFGAENHVGRLKYCRPQLCLGGQKEDSDEHLKLLSHSFCFAMYVVGLKEDMEGKVLCNVTSCHIFDVLHVAFEAVIECGICSVLARLDSLNCY